MNTIIYCHVGKCLLHEFFFGHRRLCSTDITIKNTKYMKLLLFISVMKCLNLLYTICICYSESVGQQFHCCLRCKFFDLYQSDTVDTDVREKNRNTSSDEGTFIFIFISSCDSGLSSSISVEGRQKEYFINRRVKTVVSSYHLYLYTIHIMSLIVDVLKRNSAFILFYWISLS